MRFTHAIVRPPAPTFAAGLTAADLGPPNLALALEQHRRYCGALEQAGLELRHLEQDARHPDSTFVEDTAVLTARGAVVTRPGAPSRRGEVADVERCLRECFTDLRHVVAPGTVDGGDVCEADGHFIIGVSMRTDEHGAAQLAGHLADLGYGASIVDIRANAGLLHLKTGLAYLGEGVWLAGTGARGCLESVRGAPLGRVIEVAPEEAYAANAVRVNDVVLIAAGYPRLAADLTRNGIRVVALDMSEFRRMDGGLSCLSLRY